MSYPSHLDTLLVESENWTCIAYFISCALSPDWIFQGIRIKKHFLWQEHTCSCEIGLNEKWFEVETSKIGAGGYILKSGWSQSEYQVKHIYSKTYDEIGNVLFSFEIFIKIWCFHTLNANFFFQLTSPKWYSGFFGIEKYEKGGKKLNQFNPIFSVMLVLLKMWQTSGIEKYCLKNEKWI